MFGRKLRIEKETFHRYVNTENDVSEKELPCLYDQKENCCGCTACCVSCPANAIIMKPDEEGFLYPVVDAQKCIRCYKCLKVCVFKGDQLKKKLNK